MKDSTASETAAAAPLNRSLDNNLEMLSPTALATNSIKWTTKEKLFLVSSVIMNGESNWNVVSEQMKNWMRMTNSFSKAPHSDSNDPNAATKYPIRTQAACQKQYRLIIKSYSEIGHKDAKSIYDELAKERLTEIDMQAKVDSKHYDELCQEMDKIMSMDTSEFEQLCRAYFNIRKNETKNNRQLSEAEVQEDLRINENINEIKRRQEERKRREAAVKAAQAEAAAAAAVRAAQQALLAQTAAGKDVIMTRTRASSGLEALLAQRATTTASAKETAPETSAIKEKETPAAIKSEMSTDEAMEVEITHETPSTMPILKIEETDDQANRQLASQQDGSAAKTNVAQTTETNVSIETNEKVNSLAEDEKSAAVSETTMTKKSLSDDDKSSSDDDVPLGMLTQKRIQQERDRDAAARSVTSSSPVKEPLLPPPAQIATPESTQQTSSVTESVSTIPTPTKSTRSSRRSFLPSDLSTADSHTSSTSSGTEDDADKQKKATVSSPSSKASDAAATSTVTNNKTFTSPSAPPATTRKSAAAKSSPTRTAKQAAVAATAAALKPSRQRTRKSDAVTPSATSGDDADQLTDSSSVSSSLLATSEVDRNDDTATELIFTPTIKYDEKTTTETETSMQMDQTEATESAADEETGLGETKVRKKRGRKSANEKQQEQEAAAAAVASAVHKSPTKNEPIEEDESAAAPSTSKRVTSLRSQSQLSKLRRSSANVSATEQSPKPTVVSKRRSDASPSKQPADTATSHDSLPDSPTQGEKVGGTTNGDLFSIIKGEPIAQVPSVSASSAATSDSFLPDHGGHKERSSTHQNDTSSLGSSRQNSPLPEFAPSCLGSGPKFEDDKAYRAWKKSILLVLNNISCHKHAAIFMQPVRDDIAPGYSKMIRRPMDLATIKKSVESGAVKSTHVFQRDLMIMFTNALMYNSSDHDIYKLSMEMYQHAMKEVGQLLSAQEATSQESKPLRNKEIRLSTASDRMAESNETESNHNDMREDTIDTASLKSNASATSKVRAEWTAKSKKRRPSSDLTAQAAATTSTNKRRKSGR